MAKLKYESVSPIDFLDISAISRSFGQYTCMELSLNKASWQYAPYYWRLVDNKFNLIEIGLHPSTGQLLSLTIAMYKGVIKSTILNQKHQEKAYTEITGIPNFSLNLWTDVSKGEFSQRFKNVNGRSQLLLIEDNLFMSLFPDEISYKIVIPKQFSCEFNSDRELTAVTIHNLNTSEISALKGYENLHSYFS